MVKSCSPFELSGVVDSLFTRPGRGPSASLEAPQATNVWPRQLPDPAEAGAQASLAKTAKGSPALNHQLRGRPAWSWRGFVGNLSLAKCYQSICSIYLLLMLIYSFIYATLHKILIISAGKALQFT